MAGGGPGGEKLWGGATKAEAGADMCGTTKSTGERDLRGDEHGEKSVTGVRSANEAGADGWG